VHLVGSHRIVYSGILLGFPTSDVGAMSKKIRNSVVRELLKDAKKGNTAARDELQKAVNNKVRAAPDAQEALDQLDDAKKPKNS
jgi:hypothetical protein